MINPNFTTSRNLIASLGIPTHQQVSGIMDLLTIDFRKYAPKSPVAQCFIPHCEIHYEKYSMLALQYETNWVLDKIVNHDKTFSTSYENCFFYKAHSIPIFSLWAGRDATQARDNPHPYAGRDAIQELINSPPYDILKYMFLIADQIIPCMFDLYVTISYARINPRPPAQHLQFTFIPQKMGVIENHFEYLKFLSGLTGEQLKGIYRGYY